jgi:iron complex transport system ATP-binding protein
MNTVASTTGAAYRVEDLRFSYSRSADTLGQDWALQDLSFDIAPGEIVGVIGPNGSGKSSLLKLLARVLRPQAGNIHLLGRELHSLPQGEVARTVALVPQDSLQVFPFTIAEIVLMGRFPHHRSKWNLAGFGCEGPEDLRLAEEAMRETDVAHLAGRSIGDVSGGERQRAIIARALTQQPQVLCSMSRPRFWISIISWTSAGSCAA